MTGVYKVDIQEKSEEILLGGVIAHQTRGNWVPEQDMEAVCNFADKQALTRQLYWMRIDAAPQSWHERVAEQRAEVTDEERKEMKESLVIVLRPAGPCALR